MSIIETSFMSFLDLIGYFIISSKLISIKPNVFGKDKLVVLIVIMLSISVIMGALGVISIRQYSFIYGGVFLLIFTYLVYKENFKKTIYIYMEYQQSSF